jgi:ArsR family transcriptional regulator
MVIMNTDVKEPAAACCGVPLIGNGEHSFDHVAVAFKALADPTRLRVMKAIATAGELCECNIVPAFDLSQPTISYHLKVLREAGLIESERRGQWVYHRLRQRALLGLVRHLTEIA